MHMPQNNGHDFTPPPAGTHPAIAYRCIDLGTQLSNFQGSQKKQHKIMLSWELPTELMTEGDRAGEPFTIHQRYTYSSHEKSRLRQDLESWRGVAFQDSDFGPGGFDIKNVLGKPCLLSVVHESKDGKTYANIRGLSRLPKGMAAPKPINAPVYFSLASPDWSVFDALSDGLKAVIQKSPEYAELMTKRTQPKGEPVGDAPPPHDDMSDDLSSIPF